MKIICWNRAVCGRMWWTLYIIFKTGNRIIFLWFNTYSVTEYPCSDMMSLSICVLLRWPWMTHSDRVLVCRRVFKRLFVFMCDCISGNVPSGKSVSRSSALAYVLLTLPWISSIVNDSFTLRSEDAKFMENREHPQLCVKDQ